MRFKDRLTFLLLCFLIVVPTALHAQDLADITREDQLRLFAPTSSGMTGLFTTVSADTLRRGEWAFGIYYNNYDLFAGPAPEFAFPSARENEDMSYDLYRLSASATLGLTDRWEVSAMIPWDRIKNDGGDRAGFINGFLYRGRFSDSGLGQVKLATKFMLTERDAPTRWGLSGFVDLPTGDEDSGISSGGTDLGIGAHLTSGAFNGALTYVARGDRDRNDLIDPLSDVSIPNEIRIDLGHTTPLGLFGGTTNWINEVNAVLFSGGDREPDAPVFLVSGIRHWFGNSGWALNAGARWNVAKFLEQNDECRITELDDCALSGLVGLTFAPLAFAALPPPAPAPIPVPPPVVTPAPVPPPEPPVVTPRPPQEIRVDEIHFEPGSARLTNIAKAILDEVALRMKQEPAATALVIGYTDNQENTGPNRDLDRRRAEAVRDYLVSRHGIDPARITVEGRGVSDVGDNATAEGRLRNRRVVIRLMLP